MQALLLILSLLDVRGVVRDAETRRPLGGVAISVDGGLATQRTYSDVHGAFTIAAEVGGTLRFTRLGYAARLVPVTDSVLDVALEPSARSLEGVTVTAVRGESGPAGAPIAQRVVSKDELERAYSGQEMPFLVAATPSMTLHSDGGAYSNYTYFRLRGIDQTRINITMDGVPLNDAEDQGVFFSNFPDFANSMASVQVQRGVGTSSFGTASFGGSINFETASLARERRGAELQLTRGAFGTTRASAEWQSGRADHGFAAYLRGSGLTTDGYRLNAGNRSLGAFASVGYFAGAGSAKLTALSGVSRNELAYLASPIAEIERNPRHNPLPPSDRDRFTQTVVSLTGTRLLGGSASASVTGYTVRAGGDYDVRFGDATSNFRLESQIVGALGSYTYQKESLLLSAGGHAATYWRDHALALRPSVAQEVYRNRGDRGDASLFVKTASDHGPLRLFADAQLRRTSFAYTPDAAAGVPSSTIDWTFFNPKVGARIRLSPIASLFASLGTTRREPARNDMFAGFDNVDTSNVEFIGGLDRVKPERVHDVEAGVTLRRHDLELNANLFAMEFRNEIAPIGALSYIGLPLRKNVSRSHRRGLEVDGTYVGWSHLVLGGSATWMRGEIRDYIDDATSQRYRNVAPLLTPSLTVSHTASVSLTRQVSALLDGRYVSRSFLANTSDRRFVVPPSYLLDGSLTWTHEALSVLAQLRNVLDRRVFTSGYTDGTTSYYYVAAPRNVTVTVRWRP